MHQNERFLIIKEKLIVGLVMVTTDEKPVEK